MMRWLVICILYIHCSLAQEVLQVVSRNAPTTYYIDSQNEATGFEHDLIKAFAKKHGYKINWHIKYSTKEVLEFLSQNKAHIAAAGLTKTTQRSKKFLTGPNYYTVSERVVCGEKKFPRSLKSLSKYKTTIVANSSYEVTLKALQKKYKYLQWDIHSGLTTEDIFQLIENNEIDCTIADSHIISINIRYFPNLNKRFAIAKNKELVWYVSFNEQSKKLNKKLHQWFKSFKHTPAYYRIVDKHFSHAQKFNYYDVITYHKRIKNRLPKYVNNFKSSANTFNLPWKLLAAQAYQESHWNPKAKSPTGVRGMMMITLNTAKQLGVTNRLNYAQSIHGGAKYMRYLYDILPKEISDKVDRFKFALAAYNVGLGHLYDAIALGKQNKINPYVWLNMKNLLPLLSKPQYYKKTKYGYARGYEPVQYVSRINNYYQILNNEYNEE